MVLCLLELELLEGCVLSEEGSQLEQSIIGEDTNVQAFDVLV